MYQAFDIITTDLDGKQHPETVDIEICPWMSNTDIVHNITTQAKKLASENDYHYLVWDYA